MTKSPTTNVRFTVVSVTALMAVLLYLDRFCISFAEIFIKEDLGLTDIQVGWMLSAFFWTYALAQVPSGWLTDRFGSRLMLMIYVLLWSLFTGLTGLAFGFAALMLLRFGFGLAQAGAYPTGASIISKWVPFTARGTASSVVSVGGRVGGFLALFATGYVIVFLTPRDTRCTVTVDDLLNAPLLCYELVEQADPAATADKAGEKIFALFSTAEVQVVQKHAAPYKAEKKRIDALNAPNPDADELTSLQKIGNFFQRLWDEYTKDKSDAFPQVAPLTVPEKDSVAAALNRVVQTVDLFHREDVTDVPLEKEAKRLLKTPVAERSPQQSERLNRLVLEALHRDSIRKIYGAGWRPMMFFYGALGLGVAALIWVGTRNRPREHPRCNQAEIALIEGDARMAAARGAGKVGGVPIGRMLTSRSLWLICISQWCTNVGWIFVMTWAPRYFDKVHHVPIGMRAWMVAIPPLIGWFGMVAGGFLTDWLVRVVGLRWGRALPMSLSRFLAMGAYLMCLSQPSPWFAVAMFSIVTFATDLGTASVWAFKQDVGGRYVGSILGWGNMWGNLGAAVTPPILIALVGPNQNWSVAFIACAVAFLLSGLAALGVDATVPIAPRDDVNEPASGKS